MADSDTEDRPDTPAKDQSRPVFSPEPKFVGGLDDMAGTATPAPELLDNLRGLQSTKISETNKVYNQTDRRMEEDRARTIKAYNAEGIGPDELKPWDHEKQRERYKTDPLESFGSLGSVFAVMASAFTRAPMENALNGAAAAMTAVKEGNELEFNKAYDAWKQNNELAIKRHTLQHEQYNDALRIYDSDMTAGRAKLQMLATKFGDQKTLFMLENGMDADVFTLMEKRNQAALDGQHVSDAVTQGEFRRQALQSTLKEIDDPDPIANSGKKLAAFNRIYGVKETPQQEIMGKFFYQHPNATAEESASFYEKHFGTSRGRLSVDQDFSRRWWEENPEGTPEDFSKAFGDFKKQQKPAAAGPGGGVRTPGRAQQEEIDRRKKTYIEQGLSEKDAYDRATREVKAASGSAPSGNRVDQMKARIDQFENAKKTLRANFDILKRHVGVAGLAGKGSRIGERIGNIFGSNSTDRVQFMRNVSYLQAVGPQLLLDRSGRPLSAEAGHINDILAGINPGDTTANTVRSMQEVEKLLDKMEQDEKKRLDGTWEPPASSGKADPKAAVPAWQTAPLVNP